MLNQCLESLVQKVQSGVVINFEKAGPDPSPVGGTAALLYRLSELLCVFLRLELRRHYDGAMQSSK